MSEISIQDLTTYGTVHTKDIFARRIYNIEQGDSNPAGIIIEAVQNVNIEAGTTLSLSSDNDFNIESGNLYTSISGVYDLDVNGSILFIIK